jgi:peptide/nickel transport system substrate-binding protein
MVRGRAGRRSDARGVARRAVLLALVTLAGCSRGGCGASRADRPGGAPGGTPRRGGTAVIALGAEPRSLMPYTPGAQRTPAPDVLGLIFPQMTVTEPDLVTFSPLLARSWEWAADGRSLTFHLREDARWEDGVPITAADVRFSYDVARDTLIGWPTIRWKRDIESCEVLGPHTVRYRFSRRPREAERFAREGFVLPEHLLAGVPRDRWSAADFGKHPVGGGPFRLESWEPGQRLVLVRNQGYFESGRPYLDRIVLRIVPDAATRIRLLEAGEVDFVDELTARQAETLRAAAGVRVLTCPGRDYDYLAYNLRDPLFVSPRLREALTRALDRDGIIAGLLKGYADPLDGPIVPVLWAHDPAIPRVPYDPDGARRLLAAEGWRDTDGDGWLDRDGRKLEFTVLLASDNERRREIVVAVQSQWKDVGVAAQVQQLERMTLGERREQGLFQVLYGGWSSNIALEPQPIWGCTGRNNFVHYCNSRVDSLIAAATFLPYERAKPPLFEAQRLIAGDHPYTWLYSVHNIVGTSVRLRDVRVDARGAMVNPESWWVADAAPPP